MTGVLGGSITLWSERGGWCVSKYRCYFVAVVDGAGGEVLRDGLTGDAVVIASDRQERPNRPTEGCPFCVGGLEAPEPYETRWFPNRWPTLPDDRGEVHLFSSDHDATLATLGPTGVRKVVDLWADRSAALGARQDVAYVLLFENSGAEVGATIRHPHGQAFAYRAVPDVPARELAASTCVLCEPPPGELVVSTFGEWVVWVPAAATSPFELRLAPRTHLPDLQHLDEQGRDGLASALSDAAARLDRLFDAPMPRMSWAHQRPTDGGDWPSAHLHLHIHPFLRAPSTPRYVAAGELGSGIFVNPVSPAVAASRLRSC
jgi:UDPglucose--hexose-1-phosphate uridylyltransferase